MLIKKPSDIKPSEITPESVYRNRRQFMKDTGSLIAGVASTSLAGSALAQDGDALKARAPEALPAPTTMTRPPGRTGMNSGTRKAGSAAATAALNRARK